MPAPGDQHRDTPATLNPFGESVPRISESTAQDIATLQSRLEKQLGPEYISWRVGPGGAKVPYVAADKVINLANEVFGFNGWSSQVQNIQLDFCDENPHTGKISLGLSAIVRVTLKDGTFHEDIGYGSIENTKGKAAAFEKAKKEAATDALKRALRNFGNVLGNCLYDKTFVAKISKVKAEPLRWDEDSLHRHPDSAPFRKPEEHKPSALPAAQIDSLDGADFDDEFGTDLLGEVDINSGYPDELVLPPARPRTPIAGPPRTAAVPAPRQPNAHIRPPSLTANTVQVISDRQKPSDPTANQATNHAQVPDVRPAVPQLQQTPAPHPPEPSLQPLQQRGHDPPVGFITSRAADALTSHAQPPTNLADLPAFNPNADSPSIRKTSGVNHATSAPVTKSALNGGQAAGNAPPSHAPLNQTGAVKPAATNFVNPSGSAQRKIGAPTASLPSPLANRSAYKPPSLAQSGVKRPLVPSVTEGTPAGRLPLADVSNVGEERLPNPDDKGSGEDVKRARIQES